LARRAETFSGTRSRDLIGSVGHEEREKKMNHRGLDRSCRACKGILAGVLLFTVMLGWEAAGAGEKLGMPSEAEAYRQGNATMGSSAEQVAWVTSLRKQEDRLFVNGEPFVLKARTRFEDKRGAKIGLGDIPVGSQIEVQYRTGLSLENSGYSPETKILTRIRLLEPPPGKKPVR
jgi:hypothetical protein